MYDPVKSMEEITKYIDKNYEKMQENQKLTSKPFYNFMQEKYSDTDLRKDAKRRMKQWREEQDPTKWYDYLMIVLAVALPCWIIIRFVMG
jgi:transposase